MCEPRLVDFYCYCRCGCLTIIPISDRFAAGHGPVSVTGAGDAPPPPLHTDAGDALQRGSGVLRVAVTGSGQGARIAPHPAQVEATGRPPT